MKKIFIAFVISIISFNSVFALTKLEERRISAFLKTAERNIEKGNEESAKMLAEKVLEIDPLNSDALDIIELIDGTGDEEVVEPNTETNGETERDKITASNKIVPDDTINQSSSIGALIESYKTELAIFTILFGLGVLAMLIPSKPKKKKVVKKVVKKKVVEGESVKEVVEEIPDFNFEAKADVKEEPKKERTSDDALMELEKFL